MRRQLLVTLIFLAFFAVALSGAFLQLVRGQRPALLGRRPLALAA